MSRDREQAARHVAQREAITAKAVALWEEQNRRFAQLVFKKVQPAIVDSVRLDAVAAYEAMLDAVTCERTALIMLDAARRGQPRRRGPTPPHLRPRGPSGPKDPA